MAKIHVTQIEGALTKYFSSLVDMSDYKTHKDPGEVHNAFLTRALAAFSLVHVLDISPEIAGAAVTDGIGDKGIDAVHFDSNERMLYLVQSKWHADGTSTIDQAEVLKFISGVRSILDAEFDKFNDKVKSKKSEIVKALYDGAAKFTLLIIYTGQTNLAKEPQEELDNFLRAQNDTSEIVFAKVFKQGDIHKALATGISGAPIDLDIQLRDWGQMREPFFSIYGQVAATDVANWYNTYAPRIFSPNLRMFLGKTTPNSDIIETLTDRPDQFWYFNNGITAICSKIEKKPIGGDSRDSGIFECQGVYIVNGAQTAGSIYEAWKADAACVERARVPIRFISLEKCPQDFGTEVTRFNNTQNAIEKRDFVALDPEQERIRQELAIDGVTYMYKSSSEAPTQASSFDLTEATIALACSSEDVAYSVQAKREIGKLWEDISKAPYKALFNSGVVGPKLWELVQLAKEIEKNLQLLGAALSGRDQLITIHGNRFIAYLVFRKIRSMAEVPLREKLEKIQLAVLEYSHALISVVKEKYPDSYPANLFKNLRKCKVLADSIS
jgi:hypothetical protein